ANCTIGRLSSTFQQSKVSGYPKHCIAARQSSADGKLFDGASLLGSEPREFASCGKDARIHTSPLSRLCDIYIRSSPPSDMTVASISVLPFDTSCIPPFDSSAGCVSSSE